MNYALKIVTEPTEEPVNLTEAKDHLKVEHTDEDSLILSIVKAARIQAEAFTRRSLVTQTWDLFLDKFPAKEIIKIPLPPIASITTVKYIDTNGTLTTLASTEYTLDDKSDPARLFPAFGKSWPGIRDTINAVEIRFISGYGAEAKVPGPIKAAIKILAAEMYEHRPEVIIGATVNTLPISFYRLLWPYRILEAA